MKRTYIIAEAGVNHNGDIEIAKRMIDVAVQAGVDAVKFQTFKTEKLVCRSAKKAAYQAQNTEDEESQYEMLKRLELGYEEHRELMAYCNERQIQFLSTPFDVDSLNMLMKLGMEIIKVPSGEITNYPYLLEVAKTGKEVILSTGMSTLEEVLAAVAVLKEAGTANVILLHCNTEYPTPMQDVNLSAMQTLAKETGLKTGYSDHTEGITIPIAAVASGAVVIEKHFTLDKNMTGPDHKASLEPVELKRMVDAIRDVERALGNGVKIPSESEKKNIDVARKSIVAAEHIRAGEKFSVTNLTTKRPGNGISPMKWNEVVGKVAKRDFEKDELIEL